MTMKVSVNVYEACRTFDSKLVCAKALNCGFVQTSSEFWRCVREYPGDSLSNGQSILSMVGTINLFLAGKGMDYKSFWNSLSADYPEVDPMERFETALELLDPRKEEL